MKLGLATKLSKLEWDAERLGISPEEVIETYCRQQKDVDKILGSHQRQKDNIARIMELAPEAEKVDVLALQNGKTEKPTIEMLLCIGGDNFFQICSHLFPEAYLVGVNSDPQTSSGALLYFNFENLQGILPRLIGGGNFTYEPWARVATTLNGKRVEDATCTVSLSIKATDMMSRYLLERRELGDKDEKPKAIEEQKSTGILIVSGAGAQKGAWYRNAGLYLPQIRSGLYPLVTQEFSPTHPELHTLTREPMGGEDCTYKWLNLSVRAGDELTLRYWSVDSSELSIDSINRYDVKEGDVLKFRVSDKPLKVISKRANFNF
jgi:NAD kinase